MSFFDNIYVPDKDEARLRVSVQRVAQEYDLPGGPERYLCPFHDDRSRPNLVALPPREEDPVNRFFCNSCGAKGDVIDLVMELGDLRYVAALRKCGELMRDAPEPVIEKRKSGKDWVPDDSWHERLLALRNNARAHRDVGLLSYAAGWPVADPQLDEFLVEELGWGLDDAMRVVMPHHDPHGALTAVKVRAHPPEPRFIAYGPLRHLYLCERAVRPDPGNAAVLCEGETDSAHAAYRLAAEPVDVFGLPSGAGTPPRDDWVRYLRSYPVVYLASDRDDTGAGATSARRWLDALPNAVLLPIPEGTDLRSCNIHPLDLIRSAGTPRSQEATDGEDED